MAARRWLELVNQRHPWNHNEHFHGWVLRNLPARRGLALDVGCGTGVLVEKLARGFTHVTGIDADERMAATAGRRLAGNPRVTIHRGRFEDYAPTVEDGVFDLITMVAVLHHLDLEGTLRQIPRLLGPDGRLLVVGLARADSVTDVAIDLVSAAVNPVVGMAKHPRPAGRSPEPADDPLVPPVRPPTTTRADVARAAATLLPRSALHRRLFFRYTLRWGKPAVPTER